MVLSEIEEAIRSLQGPLVAAQRQRGGRMIGFFCSYVPEEVLNVEGCASYRMKAYGATSTETADGYMGCFNCGYTRHCFELGLKDAYRFLDGFVFASGCDHIRRLYDNWCYYLDPGFIHMMDVPHLIDESSLEWYTDEIRRLHTLVARHFGLPDDEKALWDAIRLTNHTRQLLRSLNTVRITEPGKLKGREMHALSLFASSAPKDLVNPVLEEVYEHIVKQNGHECSYRAKVLLVGSHLDEPNFIDLLEETGALVVGESFCCGLRDQIDVVAEATDKDPYRALAYRYLTRLSCPRMYADFPRRLAGLLEAIRSAQVDGVIIEHLKFCETWGVDSNMLVRSLQAQGIPALRIERDYEFSSVGQIRTRVQAFLESMGL